MPPHVFGSRTFHCFPLSNMRFALLVLALGLAAVAQKNTPHGILVSIHGFEVELAVEGLLSFRVSPGFGVTPSKIDSPMISQKTSYASFVVFNDGPFVGIRTSFGDVSVDPGTATLRLRDKSDRVIISSGANFAKQSGQNVNIILGTGADPLFYGAGASQNTANNLTANQSQAVVQNTAFWTSHYWSTDGYAALGVTDSQDQPGGWAYANKQVTFNLRGSAVDLYLMPAATVAQGQKAYWDLTGAPRLPPRYAFGFLACRWGWKDRQYIYDTLQQFRSGNFPLDAWISDFEWYTPQPDYSLPNTGSPTFVDFGYNNVTFPAPVQQLQQYHNDFHLRFGGIRKPRLGNSDLLVMAKNKGWLIGGSRNLNYSRQDVQTWYAEQLQHFLKEGVDFWWNDEGETLYTTFHWWNVAQANLLQSTFPNRRFFTINRSYNPGMQRLGLAIWTGDIPSTWPHLENTPGFVLNWGLAGVAYITCDIGGFDGAETAELLTRWYQVGVFMPIMRVHSSISDTPHFPFEWGPQAADAMRKALNLRYQLVPMIYSLAHASYSSGELIMRPLFWEFSDPKASAITTQWLVGTGLMPAPIVANSTTRDVYLPTGPSLWYEFNTTLTHAPGSTLTVTAQLDQIPVFVRAGTLVPLAPVTQYTDQLPGGALDVQVYSGADADFDLVEDDGLTYDYEQGNTRVVSFHWDDTHRVLSWSVSGKFAGDSHSFGQVYATLFAKGERRSSGPLPIAAGGSINFQ
eukprot:TRINITY_DN3384_c0_g1_i1.p1 TRINITY_DN3384_c0_g1~~TRINITY_DN3384_c0_g1_i1.p1  ORF type:complete len:742 (-),score=126.42 TRINITY_DN3384_c0_g1_i1:48-2273(-)